MPFNSYSDLVTSIDNWLGQRVELQPVYPDFIMLAEQRMYRELRVREMIRRAKALLNDTWEWLPWDFIKMRRVTAYPGQTGNTAHLPVRLTGMSPGQLEAAYNATTTYPLPEAYTIEGLQIRFGPALTPQDVPEGVLDPSPYRNFECVYYARFGHLNLADPNTGVIPTTNQILQAYPELYLYASLIEAEPYLIDDQRLAVWKGLYDEALNRVNLESEYDTMSALAVGVSDGGQYMP